MSSRMLLTLPAVMLLSRLDYEDETILMIARASYFCVALLNYLLHKVAASKITAGGDSLNPTDTVIYVPIQQVGFMGPSPVNEQGPRKKTTYKEHELSECSQKTQQSMVTGLLMLFLSFKMGIHMPLPLQCVMGLVDLATSSVIRRHILNLGTSTPYKDLKPSDRPYKELFEGEEGAVDSSNAESGEDISAAAAAQASGSAAASGSLAEQMKAATLAAWTGEPFTADSFVSLHSKGADVNVATDKEGWTPLMVAAGTKGVKHEVFVKLLECGARPEVTDTDGWTALHWAGFHGNVVGVRGVLHNATPEAESMLLSMTSTEGTPLDVAEQALTDAKQKLLLARKGEAEDGEDDPAHWEAIITAQEAVIDALKTRQEEVDALLEASAAHEGAAEESKGDETSVRQRKTGAADEDEDIEDID